MEQKLILLIHKIGKLQSLETLKPNNKPSAKISGPASNNCYVQIVSSSSFAHCLATAQDMLMVKNYENSYTVEVLQLNNIFELIH